jgi:pimeloyl-ACP methyl ester carboxylesterase
LRIYEQGVGAPLVLIPSLQGRWEYLRATVEALAQHFRVVTFSLDAPDLDGYARQVEDAMAAAGLERAIICGVSFGGLVALRFAAAHPTKCDALVLASTPRPTMQLRPRHQMYARSPRLFGPIFIAESPWRVHAEVRSAIPDMKGRLRFSLDSLKTLIRAPLSFTGMASRAHMMTAEDVSNDCPRISVPTLVVTGEPGLDHVVPVEGSSAYGQLIPGARVLVLERTGHLGSITRPDAFAALVHDFIEGQRHAAA